MKTLQRHFRHPPLLLPQRTADLLHQRDELQPPRHRRVGAQLQIHQLHRLLRRTAPQRDRAARPDRTGPSPASRTSTTTCSSTSSSPTTSGSAGRGQAVFLFFDEQTETLCRGARPRALLPDRRASAARSTTRSRPPASAIEAGVHSVPNALVPDRQLRNAGPRVAHGRTRRRSGRADRVRRLRPHHLLHRERGGLRRSTPRRSTPSRK